MIEFACPFCKYKFRVDNSLGGGRGACSWCGKPIVIPQAYAEGTVTDEQREAPPPAPQDSDFDAKLRSIALEDPGLQQTRDRYAGPAGTKSGGQAAGWLIFLAIIIL